MITSREWSGKTLVEKLYCTSRDAERNLGSILLNCFMLFIFLLVRFLQYLLKVFSSGQPFLTDIRIFFLAFLLTPLYCCTLAFVMHCTIFGATFFFHSGGDDEL